MHPTRAAHLRDVCGVQRVVVRVVRVVGRLHISQERPEPVLWQAQALHQAPLAQQGQRHRLQRPPVGQLGDAKDVKAIPLL